MGYGTRAVQFLQNIIHQNISFNEEYNESPDNILINLDNKKTNTVIHYISVSFGLNYHLIQFWEKLDFRSVYLKPVISETTGEHNCIMLFECNFNAKDENIQQNWLRNYHFDFKNRTFRQLSLKSFATLAIPLCVSVLGGVLRENWYLIWSSNE